MYVAAFLLPALRADSDPEAETSSPEARRCPSVSRALTGTRALAKGRYPFRAHQAAQSPLGGLRLPSSPEDGRHPEHGIGARQVPALPLVPTGRPWVTACGEGCGPSRFGVPPRLDLTQPPNLAADAPPPARASAPTGRGGARLEPRPRRAPAAPPPHPCGRLARAHHRPLLLPPLPRPPPARPPAGPCLPRPAPRRRGLPPAAPGPAGTHPRLGPLAPAGQAAGCPHRLRRRVEGQWAVRRRTGPAVRREVSRDETFRRGVPASGGAGVARRWCARN